MRFQRLAVAFIILLVCVLAFGLMPHLAHADQLNAVISTGGNDGYVYGMSLTYSTARGTAYSSDNTSVSISFGQDYVYVEEEGYYSYVYRAFLKWDTSSIPVGATITAAKLCMYSNSPSPSTDFVIRVQKWTGEVPIGTGDYNQFDSVSYDDGNFNTASWSSGAWMNVTITNFDLITKGGTTYVCIRSDEDILNSAPADTEKVSFASYEQGSYPRLEITYSTNTAPTNDGCSALDLDSGNVLAWRKYYSFYVTATDADGVANFNYVELRFEQPADTYSNVIVRWTDSTGAFSIIAGSGYIDISGSTNATSGNQVQLTFKVAFDWDYPLTSDIDGQVYSLDDAAASDTDTYDLNMGFVNTVTTTPATSIARTIVGGSATISGTIVYTGTAIALPDSQISTNGVVVHNSAHASQGTSSSAAYSIGITLPSAVASNAYHISVDGSDSDFSDGDKGGSVSVATDQIVVYWEQLNDTRANIDQAIEGRYKAVLDYDDHALGSGDSLSCSWGALTWNSTGGYFQLSRTESSPTSVTISGWTGSETTYTITAVTENITEASYKWDSFTVYNLQSVVYLGSGNLKYEGQLNYALDSTAVNGGYIGCNYPNGTALGYAVTNSSGWFTLILGQTNASVSGSYSLFGYNETLYGITVSGTNLTLALNAWTLASKDTGGAALSGTTIQVSSGATSVWSGSPSTIRVPSATFSVVITWLQNLQVNTTSSITISADTTTSFTCLCYPYTVSTESCWVASNATISTAAMVSNILSVSFSSSEDTYLLVASCTTHPAYILNFLYDYDTSFASGYLTLTHYSNQTIQVSYESWGGVYIQRTDQKVTSASWSAQILTIVFSGTASDTGAIEIYSANRGSPQDPVGFTTSSYSASTKVWTGTYAFTETSKTVSLNWEIVGGGGPVGGGPVVSTSGTLISLSYLFPESIHAGSTVNGTIRVRWTGAPIIMLNSFVFQGNLTWFAVEGLEGLPVRLQKGRDAVQGEALINVTVRILSDALAGKYVLPGSARLQLEGSGSEIVVGGNLEFEVTPVVTSAPEFMTLLFLAVFGCVFLVAFMRKKS